MRGQFGKDRFLHHGRVGRRRAGTETQAGCRNLALGRVLRGRCGFARLREWHPALDQEHVVGGLAERLAAHDHRRRGKALVSQFLTDRGLGVFGRPGGGHGHQIRVVRGVPVRGELVGPGLDLRLCEDAALVLGADELCDVLGGPEGAVGDTAIDLGKTIPVLVGR